MDGHPEALIDLDAITANAAALAAHVGGAALMAVVKSDGYGHGMVPAARAAVTGGASWLGVVQLADAHRAAAGRADRAGAVPAGTPGRPARGRPSPPAST